MDNVQLVTRLMQSSRAGPLAQGFIIQAIDKYAKMVAEAPPVFASCDDFGLVSFETWQATARTLREELHELLDARDNPKPRKFRCPDSDNSGILGPYEEPLIGCGTHFEAVPDEEGYVDCPHCGIFFKADEPGVRRA